MGFGKFSKGAGRAGMAMFSSPTEVLFNDAGKLGVDAFQMVSHNKPVRELLLRCVPS